MENWLHCDGVFSRSGFQMSHLKVSGRQVPSPQRNWAPVQRSSAAHSLSSERSGHCATPSQCMSSGIQYPPPQFHSVRPHRNSAQTSVSGPCHNVKGTVSRDSRDSFLSWISFPSVSDTRIFVTLNFKHSLPWYCRLLVSSRLLNDNKENLVYIYRENLNNITYCRSILLLHQQTTDYGG